VAEQGGQLHLVRPPVCVGLNTRLTIAKKKPVDHPHSGCRSMPRRRQPAEIRLAARDLPADVVDRAKGLTLQNISSALLGAQLPAGQRAIAFITDEEAGVRDGATLMVAGTKATKGGAARVSNALGHA
jgi:hypothetical protein